VSRQFRIGIVGGGISGLSAAFWLEKLVGRQSLDAEISLLEKSAKLGGVIHSVVVDGYLLEAGPEGWASYKVAAKKIIQELGLQQEMIGSNDEHRRTLIVRGGRLTALPDGMMFLAPVDARAFWRSAPLTLRGKLRASLEPLVPRSQGDLSVRRFFERRLGREFTENLVEPLTSAIYGADFEELSAPSTLPELYRAEQRAGSLWKGLRRFANMTTKISVLATMRRGMAQLTEAIEESLQVTRITRGVTGLRLRASDKRLVLTAEDFEEAFDALILCTPAGASADILEPSIPEVAPLLRSVPYATSTLVYLAYRRDEFDHPLDGFGFIVPRRENRAIDACTWVNRKFDFRCPEDRILLRCAIHDRAGREVPRDGSLVERMSQEIQAIMGVHCQPVMARVIPASGGIPQLLVGHGARLAQIQEILGPYPGLALAGSFTRGVGVPDCVRTAQEAVLGVVERLTGTRPTIGEATVSGRRRT
jgi:oxygen-dependent protoporphyrinogen oxidase